MAKYLDQAGLQLVLQKITNKYDQRYLGLHATADAAQKVVHKLTINVRDEEPRVFDGSQDFEINVAQASHRHPADEIDYSNAGITGAADVKTALDIIVKNIQISSAALSSTTQNMQDLKDALDQEVEDRVAGDDALSGRLDILEDLLDGSGNVNDAILDLQEQLDDEVERAMAAEKALQDRATAVEGRLDVIEGEGEGSIKKAVKDEADLRAAADQKLTDDLAAEVARADAEEKRIDKKLDEEIAAARAAEEALSERITANKDAIDILNGDENQEGSVAKDIKDAEARVKVVTDALDGRMTNAEGRLDVIQGTGEGSIKKAIADLVDGAPEDLDTLKELSAALRDNKDVLTAIEEVFQGKLDTLEEKHDNEVKTLTDDLAEEVEARENAVAAEEAARIAADEALDLRIDDIEALIGDESMSLKEIREAIEANANAIKAEEDRAKAAEEGIQDQIDIIDGDVDTEGSFRKAIADQAAVQAGIDDLQELRMDGIDEAIGVQGEEGQVGSGLHGRIDQEAATRKSEDDRLEGRIADIEELIGDGEGSTTLADLNERLTAVEAEQIVQNNAIAENAAAIAAIVALEEADIDAAFDAVFQ